MLKKILIVVALLAAVACENRTVSVHNGCPGAVLRVSDGDNRVYADRLIPGDRVNVELTGTVDRYDQLLIVVDGTSFATGKPLGGTSRTFTLTGTSGGVTGVQQDEWDITWLPGGCGSYDRNYTKTP